MNCRSVMYVGEQQDGPVRIEHSNSRCARHQTLIWTRYRTCTYTKQIENFLMPNGPCIYIFAHSSMWGDGMRCRINYHLLPIADSYLFGRTATCGLFRRSCRALRRPGTWYCAWTEFDYLLLPIADSYLFGRTATCGIFRLFYRALRRPGIWYCACT